jgi:uncharacterized membrane protein YphA (DoxX/SURF4 family)
METAMHTTDKMHKVYQLLRLTFGLVPIVAGLDKFTNLLTNWEKYLNPSLAELLPFSASTFMMIVGVIEIAAGLLVLIRPAIGAYVVMAWLAPTRWHRSPAPAPPINRSRPWARKWFFPRPNPFF